MNRIKPPIVIIGARGSGKVLMAKAIKEAAIAMGRKVIVVRRGRYEVQGK